MKIQSHKLVLVALCFAVVTFVALLQILTRRYERFDIFQRLEWMTYDWRVRLATNYPGPCAPNLGFAFINNETISELLSGRLGYSAGLYWPRHVYGHLIQELDNQGAEAVAFDVLLGELRPDHPPSPDSKRESSDEYFVRHLRKAGNVILAAEKGLTPHDLFRTNAWAIGDITALRDSDGILRRAKAYEDYVVLHPMLREALRKFDGCRFETNRILFPGSDGMPVELPVALDGSFDQGLLYELGTGRHWRGPPQGRAFTRVRAWDLGLALAAKHLKIDLSTAVVEPGKQILLRAATGRERVIPIDEEGRFYIDWSLTYSDSRLTRESFHSLLDQGHRRQSGQTNGLENLWRGKLVVVGSVASGNDLTDLGATPLEKETFLTSRSWNVANSLILGRFIQRPSLAFELFLILGLGLISGILTWNLRALFAALYVLLLGAAYVGAGLYLYVQVRYCLPLVLPCGGLFLANFTLVTYRAVFEQKERHRIRGIFAKMVSPNVAQELLQAERLSLGGARREVTVFFSDMRGFTEMSDESHAQAEDYVQRQRLSAADAEAQFDATAQEVLRTVNLYLGLIADTVKQHEGTLDKYIGDCVMAFWGAPTPNAKHAVACVRAAIDAQKAIETLNQSRAAENRQREAINRQRLSEGQEPLPPLKLLSMGSGINTGIVTVGLMGSEQHTFNYTVFGREVNLAARLEGLSGHGRILIGEGTYQALRRHSPELAATCQELAPATVKGFRSPVRIYEVPWRPARTLPLPSSAPAPVEDQARPLAA
ncbi:MAG TPA: adenylate/guanylate cyclase domain-containing protein [Verrucomicrobiae bacterium]|nr:adenylate/guanylate cyclase domain-containing protein [Verrucomicrobiae bacterium]